VNLSFRSENSAKVLHLISVMPGIHLHEIQRILGVSLSSVRYSVERLARSGRILRDRTTGYSRFYPVTISEKERVVYSLIRNRTTRKILYELTQGSGSTNKELAEKIGLAKSTVSMHVHKLLQTNVAHLVLSEKGDFRIRIEDAEYVRKLLLKSEEFSKLSTMIANYTDLWNF